MWVPRCVSHFVSLIILCAYLALPTPVPPRTVLDLPPSMTILRAPGLPPVSRPKSEGKILPLVREWRGHNLLYLLPLTVHRYLPASLDSLPLTHFLLSCQTRSLMSQTPSLTMRGRRFLFPLTRLMHPTCLSLAHNPSSVFSVRMFYVHLCLSRLLCRHCPPSLCPAPLP